MGKQQGPATLMACWAGVDVIAAGKVFVSASGQMSFHSFAKPSSILLRTVIVIYAIYAARVALLHLLVVRRVSACGCATRERRASHGCERVCSDVAQRACRLYRPAATRMAELTLAADEPLSLRPKMRAQRTVLETLGNLGQVFQLGPCDQLQLIALVLVSL